MKRCFALLLSLLLLLGSVPMVAAEGIYNDDQFDWGDLTCFHTDAIEVEGQPSTCSVAGYTAYRYCESCHLVVSGKEPLPLVDHAYDNACDTDCNVCGGLREVGEHDYEMIRYVAPGCITEGMQMYQCRMCGYSTIEVLDATGLHEYDSACDAYCNLCNTEREVGDHVYDNGNDTDCNVCGAHRDACNHKYDHACDATCNVEGCGYVRQVGDHIYDNACDTDCNVCGAVRTVDPHAYKGEVWIQPTCTQDGVRRYTCEVCGNSYEEAIPAIGHKEVADAAVPPTCTATGLTVGSHCEYCLEVLTPQEVVPMVPHNYAVAREVAPTCGMDGVRSYACAVCGDSYEETIPATGNHTYANACDVDCDLCGYVREVGDHAYEVVYEVDATCGGDGVRSYACAICGDAYDETLPATGDHTYDNACDATCYFCGAIREVGNHRYEMQQTDATCTTSGLKTFTCAICGDSYTEAIPALGHTPVEVKGYPPTCETNGRTDGEKCSVCGAILVAQQSIPASGHSYELTEDKAPNCIVSGKKVYTCANCGDCYDERVPALGHTPVEVKGYPPTCETNGRTDGEKCSACSAILVAQQSIPATGHRYELTEDKAPNCIVSGKKVYTCSECGDSYEERVPALGHTSVEIKGYDATCETKGLTDGEQCSTCGAILVAQQTIPAIGHNYELTEDTAPTCTADGKKVYTCSNCGDSYEERVPALGHTPVEVKGYPPTCETNGRTDGEKCSTCGAILVAQQSIPATGHSYELTEDKAPNCIVSGKKVYTCANCGDSYEERIAALGHSPVEVKGYAPTCETKGLTDGEKCSACSAILVAQRSIPATGHNYELTEDKAPNCIVSGKKVYTCANCGDSYEEIVKATGHTSEVMNGYDATCENDGLTDGEKCSVCGAVLVAQQTIPAIGHNYELTKDTAPTCTADGKKVYTCSNCGDSYEEIVKATGHTSVEVKGYAPTCENDGLTDGEKCSVCGAILVEQQIIPAIGHNYELTKDTAPTCTADGKKVYTCSNCGDSYEEIVKATGHSYESVVTAPTCVAEGYTTYTCACGDSYVSDKVPATGHVYDDEYDAFCNVCGYERDALCKHAYNAVVTAPDCVNGGYTTYTCTKCEDTYVADYTDALGHNYESVVTAPDCVNGGYTTYTCTKCEDTYVGDYTDALGHNYDAVVTAPDCVNGGYTTYTCSACGDSYVDDYTDAIGHNYELTKDTAPTCTADGKKVYTCSNCGDSYEEIVKATGHSSVEVKGYAPTCENDGLTDGEKCSVCGAILVAQQTIPAIGHNYELTEDKAPTCTADGKKVYTCANCDDNYEEIVKATGHTSVEVKGYAPTCENDGLTDGEKCSVCGAILVAQQTIPTIGHNYELTKDTAPTCTADGKKVYTCANCGDSYEEIVKATGHSYESVVTAPTCVAEGYTTYTCACGDSYVSDKVPATGHVYDDEYDAFCNVCGYERDALCKHAYNAVVTAPDCVNGGYTTYTCSSCGDSYVSDYTDALGHSYDAVVTAPDCVNGGYTTYTCSACGDSYVDDYTDAPGHSYESVVTAPTCVAEGYTTHTCSACGDSYVDGQTPATGEHVYDGDSDADCNVCGATRPVGNLPGDVDGNGKRNNRDLGRLQQYINGYSITIDEVAADMDGSGRINNRDLGMLQRLLNQ